MEMNRKSLAILEYDKIKHKLFQHATTEMGKRQVKRLSPSTDLDEIQVKLLQTKDGADILRLKGGVPIPQLTLITDHLKRLEIGATLNGKELAEISQVLRSANEVHRFFTALADEKVELNYLYELEEQLETLPQLAKRLQVSLEADGYVTDDASSLLRSLRRQISTTEATIRNRLVALTRGNNAKYLSGANVTIRNDRYVIPVRAEHKGKFGGIVHDQSSSGQTYFIEPREIVELNNRLKQEQVAEKEEILRILRELSEETMPYTAELAHDAKILGEFDFINTKAKYAKELKATQPLLSEQKDIYLRQVWHPLLEMDKAVKNDIILGKDYQAMVITGPNTGGKTITLKTLGLVQMMGQSGLFIPAFENSRIGVFKDIFADIGDEQSIEQSLSTFSSHMTNIVNILERVDQDSLVLFDELGAGTDPQEGAALAIAILDAIGASGAYVLATTHYPELKTYGFERTQTINASMEFNEETLRPTYRLLIGIPGQSNAFNISERLGLSQTIVTAAQNLVAKDSQDLNNMIADLVAKRRQAEEEAISLQANLDEAQKLHHDLATAYERFVNEREQMQDQAKQKANEIVEQAKRKADEIISELRALKQNAATQIKENELIDAKANLNALEQKRALKKNKVLKRAKRKQAFKPNDDVMVTSYGQRGVLVQKVGEHVWEVQLGILKMKIDEADLEKINVEPKKVKRAGTVLRSAKTSHVSPQLDLRGKRYEEAMTEVDRYIDAAILAGYPSVTIVHGKGTGALRQGITQYLQSNRAVKSFNFAAPNNGGNGATVVYFR